jgi:hypothetical protein
VVGVVIFIGGSGEEEEEGGETAATVAVAGSGGGATATGATPGGAVESAVSSLEAGGATASATGAPPASVPTPTPPKPFVDAYDSGKTVALLIVDPGSIDSALTARFSRAVAPFSGVRLFTIKAKEIARYAAVTVGLEVNRVPALIVLKPKRLSHGTPQGTVDYGLQTPQSVAQAVLDANYKGRELAYHPN